MGKQVNNLDVIRRMFKEDVFARALGIELDEINCDSVKMHMELQEKHVNFYNRPHGGAIYSLADAAFSVIGNNENIRSVAIECSISYHYSPDVGDILHVDGKKVAQSRRIGTYLFEVYVLKDDKKILVATMKSTLYRTGKPIIDDD